MGFSVREVRFRPRLVPFKRVVTAVTNTVARKEQSRAQAQATRSASVKRGAVEKGVQGAPSVMLAGARSGVGGGCVDVYYEVAKRVLGKVNSPLAGWCMKPGAPRYVKIGDHVMPEPKAFRDVRVEGGRKLLFKLDLDAVKRVASLTDNGKATIAISLDNGWSTLTITVDKNGNISIPDTEKGIVGIGPDGTVIIDAVQALPPYRRGKGVREARLGLWVRVKGVQGPVTGQTVKFS